MRDYWTGGQVPFAGLVVGAAAGDESHVEATVTVSLAVLDRTADQPYATQVRLHSALCTVVRGGIDRGALEVVEILGNLPAARRSHMIMETGRAVLRAVPVEGRNRPAVRDLRVLVSGPGAVH